MLIAADWMWLTMAFGAICIAVSILYWQTKRNAQRDLQAKEQENLDLRQRLRAQVTEAKSALQQEVK
ncbi:MAG: hypothetical protein WAL20_02370, partial [Rhodomicrobium sp.]